MECRLKIIGALEQGGWGMELVSIRDTISVWDNENVTEMDGGDSSLMPLKLTVKNY